MVKPSLFFNQSSKRLRERCFLAACDVRCYNLSMSIDQIASEALRLSPRERALLAESLWESLEDPFISTAELSEKEAEALAIARDRQMKKGEVQSLSHDELMKRLRK